ncbi:hypothetical protein B0T25DRAFT_496507 [Lasiosphaeria hispida]|uniref:Uncharacterized protein n=1 Tax=Lasiosphaeria hispida TaxID=260671 RepID=A0AAJ0HSD3_9PEZI|nr:hypothetical protein B0T25DRAFT_496507 [Lasiosphaeria hispida]
MWPKIAFSIIALTALGHTGIAQSTYRWSECKQRVLDIQTGNLTLGLISNETIDQYLYHGQVVGLDKSFPRDKYLSVTYQGCLAICGNPIAFYEPQRALSLASNWIFPLAILLNLPWESLHRQKLSKTLVTALNWLGSPQTALTAIIFNFHQLRDAYRRTPVNSFLWHLYSAAYYVLYCVDQFDGLTLVNADAAGASARPAPALEVLMYGLFRPLSKDPDPDVRLTNQLLVTLAFQLRILRRRNVIPTLANLMIFLIAFIFSVILAFGEMGADNTPFSLTFGLFVTWLPLLVVFSIVDRNPVSTDRTAILISRWLYNVYAVKTWAVQDGTIPTPIKWWRPGDDVPDCFRAYNFIGQGRELGYRGLLHATLKISETADLCAKSGKGQIKCTEEISIRVAEKLSGRKPWAWYVTALTALLLVWTAVLSAFVVSFYAPTVGLHCRPLTYLLFGVFSSVPWIVQFSKRSQPWAIWVSHVFNSLAILAFLAAIVFQVTGVTSNCFCRSSAVNLGYAKAYLDFEGFAFYRQNFNVDSFWISAAVVGGLAPAVAFMVALFWWFKCKPFWRVDENETQHWPESGYELQDWVGSADTAWLQ